MRRLLFFFVSIVIAADHGTKVEYIGGTLEQIKAGNDVRLLLSDASVMGIDSKEKFLKIPYDQINQIEYGQKVGRNIVPAIVISPLFLLNKTRKHFLTLGFLDQQGNQQALVLRVGKGNIRALLASLEARTGQKVQYLDPESRKL